jgi:hypothetical protein
VANGSDAINAPSGEEQGWPCPSSARWVCLDGCDQSANLYLEFVHDFDFAPGEGEPALFLDISAVTVYRAWVNGVPVGQGPAVGEPTALYFFHRHAVPRSALRPGTNRLAVLLFHDGAQTSTIQGFHYGRPGLIARLEDASRGGGGARREISATGDGGEWRVRRSPVFSTRAAQYSSWGGWRQSYHGEREDGWQSPEHICVPGDGWQAAVSLALPESANFVRRLTRLDVAPLAVEVLTPERLCAAMPLLGRIDLPPALLPALGGATPVPFADGQSITVAPGEAGAMPTLIFDFGRLVVGHPIIEVEGGGCVYEVWYGETLEMLRTDVVRPPADEVWRSFQRRAFRYLKIAFIGLPGPVVLKRVSHEQTWYDYDTRGRLELAEDTEMVRILDVSRYTLRVNTSYHYEDCPVREQACWLLDLRVMSLINLYLFGNPEMTARCLRQAFALQRPDGSLPSTGPKDNECFHLDFLFHLAATLREYHAHTGDAALVAELFPAVRRMHAFIQTYRDPDDGLLDSDRGRPAPYIDWSDRIEKLGKTTVLNALYRLFLEDLAALSSLMGDGEAAAGHRAEAQRVAAAANMLLFDPGANVYRDAWRAGRLLPTASQQANMAAVAAGFVSGERAANIVRTVWDEGGEAYPRPFGPSYYLIVFEALHRVGRQDAILAAIRDYWGEMLRRGATTWWEVFDSSTPAWVYPHTFLGNIPTFEMDHIPISACHGWSGVPGYAVPRYLLGVDLSGVASGRVVVRPALPLAWPRAEYAVPVTGPHGQGMLRLEFEATGASSCRVTVREAPPGVTITVDTEGGAG